MLLCWGPAQAQVSTTTYWDAIGQTHVGVTVWFEVGMISRDGAKFKVCRVTSEPKDQTICGPATAISSPPAEWKAVSQSQFGASGSETIAVVFMATDGLLVVACRGSHDAAPTCAKPRGVGDF